MVREVDAGTTTAGGPFYYTAFGERCYYDTGASSWKIGGEFPVGSPRYMYDGGHGYENGFLSLAGANTSLPAITLQHVGERWYEPDIGRFVQRDPIGLGGGLNTYEYSGSLPSILTDPDGLKGRLVSDPPVMGNGKIIVVWYEECRDWWTGVKYLKHDHTQFFQINSLPRSGNDFSGIDNDIATCVMKKQINDVNAVTSSIEGMDDGARKVMKRLSSSPGPIPLTVEPEDVLP